MDMTTVSLSCAKLRKPLCSSNPPSSTFAYSKSSNFAHSSVGFTRYKNFLPTQLKFVEIRERKEKRYIGIISASGAETESPSTVAAEDKWLLQPVGDGDWSHIGFKVQMPGAYEIASDVVTVGRVPDKADMVIPVATVSGLHARIQKKEGRLLVTDLDSTNGTFVGEQRLKPGAPAPAPPGSLITFGDTNLAIFRVLKIENIVEATKEPEEPEVSESDV